MNLIPATQWSADPDAYARMQGEDQGRIQFRVAHWPGGRHVFDGTLSDSIRMLRAYERFHMVDRGWRGLAYDDAIDLSGRYFEIRMTGMSAATSGEYGETGVPNNRISDATLFLVGPGQKPSKAMIATAERLDRAVPDITGRWYGHDEASGPGWTDCPGPHVQRDIVEHLRNLEDDPMRWFTTRWPTWSHTTLRPLAEDGVITESTDPNERLGDITLVRGLIIALRLARYIRRN